MSQLFKDAILRKLAKMERKMKNGSTLINKRLPLQFLGKRQPQMIKTMQPYKIKLKTGSNP